MSANAKSTVSADEALLRLKAGNDRFVAGTALFSTVQKEVLADLAKGQSPYATILSCSDSRVPPELVFDAGFGELFIVRVAGNVISPEVAGSLQYAGRHPHTPLFVVLGYTNCGAIVAALDTKLHGTRQLSRIQILIDCILPGMPDSDSDITPEDLTTAAYFSTVTYTTTSYGDLVLPAEWRLVGGIEALTGIPMCGLSAGMFFAVFTKMFTPKRDSVPPG